MDTVKERNIHVFRWRPFLRQLFVCSTTWVYFFMFGLSLGTPTIAIPQLRKHTNSTSSISDEMVSLISAVVAYVGVIWVVGLSLMAHYFGRKIPAIIVAINASVAFIVLYCSTNATHLLIAQILHGMTAASLTTTSLLLVTEFSTPRYRGIFLTIKSATVFWGVWAANAIGAFYDYRNIGILGIVCSVYNLIAMLSIPESPYWLSNKRRYDECVDAHRWLKGVHGSVERELNVLIGPSKNLVEEKKQKKTIRERYNVTKQNITKPEIYKPLSIIMLILTTYHCSGKFVVTMYSIQMIKKITNSESMAYTGMLILDGFTVLGMYIGCGFSKVLKRRTLLLTSATIGTLFMYIMSVYLYLIKFSIVTENDYVSIGLLTGFSIAVCCGPMILSGTLFAELAPLESRSFCLCLASLVSKLLMGSLLHISPFIFKTFGFHGTFLSFALSSTVCLTLLYKYLPETKDKTLHEISELFKAGKQSETESIFLNRNMVECVEGISEKK